MKYVTGVLFGLLIIFIFGPLGVLFVDGVWLFFTGHVLTSIPWDEGRVLIALVWPWFFGFIAAGVSS